MRGRPEVNGERLLRHLSEFAEIGKTKAGGVNRQALSSEDRAARHLLADLSAARGFKIFQDAIANLFIRREGRNPALPPMLIGSHLDSQPTGGRFDGALGTLAAFEVLEALEDAGHETEVAIEVVAWTNEEGSRFAPGVMGSMAFVGAAHPDDFQSVTASDGASFREELAATLAALPEAKMRAFGAPISAYLELHIEQGPSLEREGLAAGVVTAVQGTRWLTVTFSGSAGHAGTTSLAYRRDPMVAATAALNRLQMSVMPQDDDARLTVGRFSAHPGSINAIPDRVTFTVDIRHPDAVTLAAIEAWVRAACEEAAASQRCSVEISTSFDMPPGSFSKVMTDRIEEAAKALELPCKRMISGAFHDALFIARVAPAAMIFVPCRDGISHNEAEYVEPADAINGTRLLLEATMESVS
ncbi:Zn-dependent hydrolase [Agrobacterium sp. 13-626]|uniref:Zn-dependent hydrolase n=1 Tax=Rhizobium rhizogenes TaxID=359 RepID=UPI00080F892D|nr:Zn-dependent hydrolase [Rhizobium rhizogenes]NTG45107.1 Zn-dependent hydrolase [Rhizobium rhizogenes]OCJ01460.1 Zn-dependent hydrolase [Agrobacterium sp. 13-626]